ncbi:DUF2511 domain-containing protein [Floridanema evergladense]|uniref:DUF2511 domain-containing protein n=1 Tax=Floridaenema evergladense BLCC-F167 TaxID=3153639 RepID=A0ABV4WDW8_9CYAN
MKKLLLAALLSLTLIGCESTTATIERSQYGDNWPFTVEAGVLSCTEREEVVFASGRTIYALNGAAINSGKYVKIEEIWADNPAIPGTKKSIRDILNKGLELCK